TEEIETLYILGYSDGANIGIKYATLYPKRVTRLVLNAPNLSKKGVYQVLWWFDRTAQFLMRLLAPINHYAKRRYKQLHVMSEPLNISRRDLERISAPTLLVIGRFDLVKKRHIERIAAILPHAEVMIIPRGGHFVTYTNPKKFSALVLPFLQQGEEHEKV
uniref:alpha/beta fold hydrolase n=1 Tax=Leuconostoc lactis TaxID=1246 RepID=UPI0028AF776B